MLKCGVGDDDFDFDEEMDGLDGDVGIDDIDISSGDDNGGGSDVSNGAKSQTTRKKGGKRGKSGAK